VAIGYAMCRPILDSGSLWTTGERLPDGDVDQIFKLTGIEEDLDGNIKYAGSFVGLHAVGYVAKNEVLFRKQMVIGY